MSPTPSSPPASSRSSTSSSSTCATAATRRRCARSARPSASPRRPRCTRTWPRSSASATCAATPPSPAPSRCATTPTRGAAIERRPVRHVPARRRRRRRHRRARPGERRGDPPAPGRPHRRRRAVHAAGPGRLDDRRRHPRRRLRRGPGPDRPPSKGDIVVAGIPGDEATVKTFTPQGRQGRARAGQRHDSSRWSSTPTRSRSSARSSRCCASSDRRPAAATTRPGHAWRRPAVVAAWRGLVRASRAVPRSGALEDVDDHAVLVDHERGPVGAAERVVEHAVGLGHLAVGPEVRQHREVVALLLGPAPAGRGGVSHETASTCTPAASNLREVVAQPAQLALADPGEGERVEDQGHGLVAAEARRASPTSLVWSVSSKSGASWPISMRHGCSSVRSRVVRRRT